MGEKIQVLNLSLIPQPPVTLSQCELENTRGWRFCSPTVEDKSLRKVFSISSLWSVFLITLSTVNRSAFCWFERNFTFLTTVRANSFVHLSRLTVRVTHFLTSTNLAQLLQIKPGSNTSMIYPAILEETARYG